MARKTSGAVFFVGDLPRTTRRFAKMAWRLCRKHGGTRDLVFVNVADLTTERYRQTNSPCTFFIDGAPSDEKHLPLLYDFEEGSVVVHVNFQGDLIYEPKIQSVLGRINDVPIIDLNEQKEDDACRLSWILNKLGETNKKPLPAEIIMKALMDRETIARVTNHLPAHVLATA